MSDAKRLGKAGLVGCLAAASSVAVLAVTALLIVLITHRSSAPTPAAQLEKVEAMGSLVVLRAHMADVVSRKSSWGPSESRILLKARGDADIAVDLRRAKLLSSDTKARVIRILLPKPSVERPRVDHDKTVVYDSNDGFIAPKPVSELTQDALKEAQQTFASAANEKEMLDAARKNAELVIGKFLELSDWQAQFVWEDQQ